MAVGRGLGRAQPDRLGPGVHRQTSFQPKPVTLTAGGA